MEGPYKVITGDWLIPGDKAVCLIEGMPFSFHGKDKEEKTKDYCYMLNWAHKMRLLKEKEKQSATENNQ